MNRTIRFSVSILLLLLWSGLGCGSPSGAAAPAETTPSDAQAFAAILRYYKSTFAPGFDGFAHLQDGPTGRLRLHIQVPVAVSPEYQHPFSRAFLVSQSKSNDGLSRNVAKDLLLLQGERLGSHKSQSGVDGVMVGCVTYVVRVPK